MTLPETEPYHLMSHFLRGGRGQWISLRPARELGMDDAAAWVDA